MTSTSRRKRDALFGTRGGVQCPLTVWHWHERGCLRWASSTPKADRHLIIGSYEAISRSLRSAMAAECQRFVEDHIPQRRSFAVETTLRSRVCLEQAASANAAGFHTQMQFLATDSADENIRRVMARAQSGGHGASERDILAIYDAALANLSAVVRCSTLWTSSTPQTSGNPRAWWLRLREVQLWFTQAPLRGCGERSPFDPVRLSEMLVR